MDTAFKYNRKGIAGDQAYRENIIDWYRTIGREPRKSSELAKINELISNTNNISQKRALVNQFNELGNLKDISAYLVTNTIPTYSKVPEVIRAIRKLPIGNHSFPCRNIKNQCSLSKYWCKRTYECKSIY